MAKVIGNLEVRGDLNVEGESDALGRTVHYDNISESNQTVDGTALTDCAGLTGKAFPSGRNAPDGVKTYRVDVVVNFIKGNNGYLILKAFVGADGDSGDALECAGWQYGVDNQQLSIALSYVSTPSSGDKIGLAAASENDGGGTDMIIQAGDTLAFVGGYLTITRVT